MDKTNLEEALYELCSQDDAIAADGKFTQPPLHKKPSVADIDLRKSCILFKLSDGPFHWNIFRVVTLRTWHLLISDWFMLLLYPSMLLYMFSLSFYKLPNVEVAVMNEDSTQANAGFATILSKSMSQRIELVSYKAILSICITLLLLPTDSN